MRRVGDDAQQLVARALGLGQPGLEPLEVGLHLLQLLDLLRRRLALHLLLAAQLVHLWNELAPALVRGQELVELRRA